MVEFSSVLATMWPSLQYAGCWHAYYWAGHVTFSALWGAYTTPSSESHDFYVKKLRLKGLHDAEARRATRGYFQNYFLTSFLAATHGVIMGVLLVPFIWEHSAFLTEAVVSSTTDDPRGEGPAHGIAHRLPPPASSLPIPPLLTLLSPLLPSP